MVIGIQANSRLSLPGKNDNANPSGRASADSIVGTSPDPEAVEIQNSAAAADQPAIVQLNAPGLGARYSALLAGDRPLPDPTTLSQASPAPAPVQEQGVPAAAADLPPLPGAWIPQILSGPAGLLGRMRTSQGTSALNASFIDATRDLASTLLTSATPTPARVIALADSAAPSHTAATVVDTPDAQ